MHIAHLPAFDELAETFPTTFEGMICLKLYWTGHELEEFCLQCNDELNAVADYSKSLQQYMATYLPIIKRKSNVFFVTFIDLVPQHNNSHPALTHTAANI